MHVGSVMRPYRDASCLLRPGFWCTFAGFDVPVKCYKSSQMIAGHLALKVTQMDQVCREFLVLTLSG